MREGKRATVEATVRVKKIDGYSSETIVTAEQTVSVPMEPEALEDAIKERARMATRDAVDQVVELPAAVNELAARREHEREQREAKTEDPRF